MKRLTKRFKQDVSDYGHPFKDDLIDMEDFIMSVLSEDAKIIALTGNNEECLLVYLDKDTK